MDIEYLDNNSSYYDTSYNGATYNNYMLESITTDVVSGYTETPDDFSHYFGPQTGYLVDLTQIDSYIGFDAVNVLANNKYMVINAKKDY